LSPVAAKSKSTLAFLWEVVVSTAIPKAHIRSVNIKIESLFTLKTSYPNDNNKSSI
jgi:hypothetical protein